MNIPQGYKSSPLGIIPKDWEVKKLGEIGIFVKGYGVPKDHIKKVGHPCLTYGDLYTKYDVVIKNIQSFIDDEDAATSQKIYDGDILFAGSGETPEDIGRCAAYIDKQIAYAGGDIIILRPTIPYNNLVLSYILNSDIGGRQRYQMAQGHSVVHIYPCNLEKISIPLPPLAEQERIAELLGTWDRAIEMQKQLIDKLEVRKKGLMQQLLTGKKRLPGFTEPWVKKELGDLLTLKNGYAFKADTYINGGKYKIITIANVQNGRLSLNACNTIETLPTNIQDSQILKEGDILISMTGNVGRVCVVNQRFCLQNQRVGLLDIDSEISKEFIFTILNTSTFECAMIDKGHGAAQPNIGKLDIEKYSIRIPSSIEEQTAIANIFSSLDNEIQKLTEKRDKYIEEKKGLMQVLLTGKKRVSLS